MSATAAVAAFALGQEEPPPGRADAVARALLDTVGCALAASGLPIDAGLERWLAREGGGSPVSTVWTTGERVSPERAAFLNGTLAHALDWDDVSPAAVMHPSTVLLPALLAEAEASGASGTDVVAAHDVGAAAFRALTHALPRSVHYGRGWHTTSTVGRLAAVAALARLLGLDETSTRHALGLAGSLAAGSLANFGTMTKPLHAGVAARDAVQAVALAADGFTANDAMLEAPSGFFALYGELDAAAFAALPTELERWRMEWPRDWALKRYPACYATHRAVDAMLALRARVGEAPPERIDVVVEPGGLRPLIPVPPTTPTAAKFSMEYVLSVALVHGDVRLRHFAAGSFDDERVMALLDCIRVREGEPSVSGDGYAVVTVEGVGSERVEITYGDARNPLSEDDLDAKFADCCEAGGLDDERAAAFRTRLRAIPHVDAAVDLQ